MDGYFEMGGYAFYVWTSYGVTALVLIALAVFSLRANAAAKAEVERLKPKRQKRPSRVTEAAPQEAP